MVFLGPLGWVCGQGYRRPFVRQIGRRKVMFFFAGVGNASTFKQMPMLFVPRQAGGVIGFTGAIAAYGPFIFGMLFATSFTTYQSATPVFYGLAVFFAFNFVLNWWMYARSSAVNPC
jgi:NNP family nitrate/nitrite transporter-like MFS transporter